ncbi:MAG: protein kinase family protein, partial [Planctomycetota bacterium]
AWSVASTDWVCQLRWANEKRILEMEFVEGCSLADWIRYAYTDRIETAPPANRNTFRTWLQKQVPSQITERRCAIPVSAVESTHVAAWLTLHIAVGLKHAHDRGVLHQDIKPANVLVDRTGVPLLTDFNVALIDGQNQDGSIGGTILYMSPEQLRAFYSGDPKAIDLIDLRSDIYSLGLVLLELLGGSKKWGLADPNSQQALVGELLTPKSRFTFDQISFVDGMDLTLAAIVEKALMPDPSERYQSVFEFETDLKNWLDGRSNRFAPNPSRLEQLVRFEKRNRFSLLSSAAFCLILFGVIFLFCIQERAYLSKNQATFQEIQNSLDEGRGAVAAERIGAIKSELNQLWLAPFIYPDELLSNSHRVDELSIQIRNYEQARFSSLFGQISLLSVHKNESGEADSLVRESLNTYGILKYPDWETRTPFVDIPSPQQGPLTENIAELMLVSMVLSSRQQKPAIEQWNEVIHRIPTPHRNYQIFQALRDRKLPEKLPEGLNRFELYLYGVWATLELQHPKAFDYYSRSLKRYSEAGDEKFWLRYRLGFTAHQLGNDREALNHYSVCLGMQPNFAWIPYNMALIEGKSGLNEAAVQYLRRAIHLDPKFSIAYIALATLHFEAGEWEPAYRTCEKAIEAGIDQPELFRIRSKVRDAISANDSRQF